MSVKHFLFFYILFFFPDKPTCSWSKKEVLTLLTHWANPAVQEELSRNVRNNAVYSSLSAKLASLGYDKSAQKCKEKLKKLKQDYRRIKNSNHLDGGKNIWFDIIDQVLGGPGGPAAAAPTDLETQRLASAEPSLPIAFEENCKGISEGNILAPSRFQEVNIISC